jgi:hypothetical protein
VRLKGVWNSEHIRQRSTNLGTVVIKGKRVNGGAGYGVELPSEFKFRGDSFSCDCLKHKLKKEKFVLGDLFKLLAFLKRNRRIEILQNVYNKHSSEVSSN